MALIGARRAQPFYTVREPLFSRLRRAWRRWRSECPECHGQACLVYTLGRD